MSGLHQEILERLVKDGALDAAAVNLVDAACTSDGELDVAIAKLDASEIPTPATELLSSKATPAGVFLSKIQVAGFRGIGPEQTLSVTPGPGLTLLVGRNGSGKSSFAEGLEILLTGTTQRWAERTKEWKDGWKNLHTESATFVEAAFAVEGGDPVVVRRAWAADAELEASVLKVRRGTQKHEDLSVIGWTDALGTFRPFLSYAELGALLNRPSELYDSLKGILGLEELTVAIKRLSVAHKVRKDHLKHGKDECKRLLPRLAALPDDPRAQRCHDAMKGRAWKLDEVETVLLGGHEEDNDQVLQVLRQLAQLAGPGIDAVATAVSNLRKALGAQAELAGTAADQNARLAQVLEQAIHYCGDDTAHCPVCGGALSSEWSNTARDRLKEARELATKVREVTDERDRSVRALRALIRPVPPGLSRSAEAGMSTALLDAWTAWIATPTDPVDLCDHAEQRVLELHALVTPLADAARQKLQELESVWRPVALELAMWLDTARRVATEDAALRALESAEKWLKDAEAELRDARFEPLAARAQSIWNTLRQQSSVDLAKVKLDGKGTKRHVSLNVSVDGREGVAVGVMSQGELNALALSLFLPRMMLAESPFRFLIIDDPVQAMDSHKVDGLARVLEEVAKTRQVIVLTHDSRLLEATRRLQIDATVLAVQRRADSVVEVLPQLDPVEQHLKDALSIVNNEREIGTKMAARTVPAFCRLAIEAACIEAIRRRRLGRGDAHVDVEAILDSARGVHPLATLAIYDNDTRDSEVFAFLKNKLGKWATDTFVSLKSGAHGDFQGDVRELVSNSRKIANMLRANP